jgi:hypothetical protein
MTITDVTADAVRMRCPHCMLALTELLRVRNVGLLREQHIYLCPVCRAIIAIAFDRP